MLESLEAVMYNRKTNAISGLCRAQRSLTTVPIKEELMADEILPQDRAGFDYQSLGENVGDRDNQQERLMKLIWLTAMLEAEGTFTFQYAEQEQDGALKCHITPRIIFVNTDFVLVDRTDQLITEFSGIKAYRGNMKGGLGRKPKNELQINGQKTLPLLKILHPYVYGSKKEAVEHLISFVEYRQSLKHRNQVYGDYEYSLVARVREINSGHWRRKSKYFAISSETVRQRREAVWAASDAKIQSELHGDMQSVAEMITPLSARKLSRRQYLYPDYAQK
jgi:hypothetical protein